MKRVTDPHVLFYPFHLCHQETLGRLLMRFQTVHFRDFMAMQLTPFSGMTAFHDQMGDIVPELVANGRLVQGYSVSGPLSGDVADGIDRDLGDAIWRKCFHAALKTDRSLQRGLFLKARLPPVFDDGLESAPFSVQRVRELSMRADRFTDDRTLEYGLALVKSSAALVYTYRLALAHGLQTATDSASHYFLFERSCRRERISISNHLLLRRGY